MTWEVNLKVLITNMQPQLNIWDYVFCSMKQVPHEIQNICIMLFKESEWFTIILERLDADKYGLKYDWIMAWITLHIHSSLDAVGLTAAFSKSLWENNISCNVVAWFYHDHIFVWKNDSQKALDVLNSMTNS